MNIDITHPQSQLSERERRVLYSIVENFVESGAPVGSRLIARKSDIALSPATIRNVMMDLEEMGYLTHPHTSAGRLPTDKGYRLYVDSLMGVCELSDEDKRVIYEKFLSVSKQVDSILEAASHVIARISKQLGVVLSPRFFQGVFEKIELVSISGEKVLMVLSIKSGLVRTILLEIENAVSRDVLERVSTVINERLHGLSLREIQNTIESRFRDVVEPDANLVRLVANTVVPSMRSTEYRSLHFGGTQNIMIQPEFSDQTKLSNVLNLLERKEMLVRIFDQSGESGGNLSIAIGEENHQELIKYCTLITATYNIGSVTGSLGVLGPTRMNYSKVMGLVDFMANTLTEVLEENVGGKSSKSS